MNKKAYTLSDLTTATGAKRRSVQLWAEAGVLIADSTTERAGSGTHRTFDANEVVVACLVHALSQRGVTIGKILTFSKIIRMQVFTSELHVEAIRAAIANTENVYVIVATDGIVFCRENDDLQKTIPFIMKRLTEDDMTAIIISLNVCLARARRHIDAC